MESHLKAHPVSNNKSLSCAYLQMESNLEAYAVWYPPVRSSLLCLSKLYGNVDPSIFNGMAQDAVHAATSAVQVLQSPLLLLHRPSVQNWLALSVWCYTVSS